MNARDWEAVLSRCNEIAAIDPNALPPAYFALKLQALNNLGRVADAEHILNDAISQGVPQVNLWMQWLRNSFRMRDWAEVARRAGMARKQFPDNPTPALLEGMAWFEIGDLARAHASLGHPQGEVEKLALKLLRLTHGDALALDFEGRWRAVSDVQGAVAGTQHFRNLLLQGPERLTPGEGAIANIMQWVVKIGPKVLANGLDARLRELANGLTMSERTPDRLVRRPMIVCAYMTEATPGPHMRFINGFAGALATLDEVEKVTILVTQECEPECVRATSIDAGPWDAQRNDGWHRDLAHVAGEHAHKIDIVVVGKHGAVYPQEAALDLARDHNPDMLFPILGILESPVVAQVLARSLPTVGIQSSMTNSVPEFADIVMAHGGRQDLNEPGLERCRSYRIPVYPFPRTGAQNPDIPSSSARIRLVSALSGGRLEQLAKSSSPDRKAIAAFLQHTPDVDWILLGAEDPDQCRAILAEDPEDGLASRVTVGGFVPDLRAIFALCDIYLQPSTNPGGAMGVAMAIEEGLPVIAMHDCDAGIFLPHDSLIENYEGVVDKLQGLVLDPAARTALAGAQRAHMREHHSIETCGQDMAGLMREALALFSDRPA